jgi:hypothetical protein
MSRLSARQAGRKSSVGVHQLPVLPLLLLLMLMLMLQQQLKRATEHMTSRQSASGAGRESRSRMKSR